MDFLTAATGMTDFGARITNDKSIDKKKKSFKACILKFKNIPTGPLTLHLAGAEDHTELASF